MRLWVMILVGVVAFLEACGGAPVQNTPGCNAYLDAPTIQLHADGVNCELVTSRGGMVLQGLRVEKTNGTWILAGFVVDTNLVGQTVSYQLPNPGVTAFYAVGPGDQIKNKTLPASKYCRELTGSMHYEVVGTTWGVFFDLQCTDAQSDFNGDWFSGWYDYNEAR